MPKKNPKLIYHLICDDIRKEAGNKFSYMGVYRGPIYIPMPFILPKLCFHLAFNNIKPEDTIEIELKDPNDNVIVNITPQKINLPEKKKFNTYVIETVFAGLNIQREGDYKLICTFGEKDKTNQEIKINFKNSQNQPTSELKK